MMAFLIFLLAGIPLALLRGVVLRDMVWWYTPYHLGIIQAVGMSFIVTFFLVGVARHDPRKPDETMGHHVTRVILNSLGTSLMWWGFAYVWHLFL